MSAPLYPVHLDVREKRVLVVGAGTIATRRVTSLVDAGARVVVVAPRASEQLQALAADGVIEWRPRRFDYSDVIGAWLVHTATDDAVVNARVAEEAARRGIWAVRADTPGDARTPSVAAIDGITVSVTSGDPQRTRVVRDTIALGLQDGSLGSRPHRARAHGSVVLIGGGPGDEGLITVRGRRELLQADVIVDRARRGLRVARLKGGDPFVLGRGSEELLACARAGIPVEVVPGVTSAISGPAAAGIPVTHRGTTAGFVVVSGHELGDLAPFAQSDLTLVVLMGVARIGQLTAGLIALGKAPDTPAAIVERAWTPTQRVTSATVATLAQEAARAGASNPAIIVIGDVVRIPDEAAALAPALAGVT